MQVELCRLCLCKENLKPIFSDLQKSNNYSVILMLTTGLQIDEEDGFPQMICNSCSELVKSSFELRNTSRKSESKLKKLGYRKNKEYKEYRNEIKTEEKCGSELVYTIKTESLIEEEIIKCENPLGFNRLTNPIDDDQIEDDSKTSLHQDDDVSHTSFHRDDDAEVQDSTVKSEAATGSEYILTKNGNIKTLSRKEKRAVYMNLVEGEFDPEGPIKCKVCKKTVNKWASFMTHSKLHLGFKFVCEYCGKSFISSTQLNRHCRSYHGMSRELACRHCDYLALDNTQLVLHERRVHTGERPFICDLCGTSYFSRRCLIQHIENHSTVKTIQCEKCPQMFKSRRHLARHTYTTHTSKQYSYKCPICAHIYRNLKYIRVHLKKLHGLTTKDAKIVKIKL